MKLLKSMLMTTLLLVLVCFPVTAGSDADPGDIVINEIMLDPLAVADGFGEWIEIYNTSNANININGWTLEDEGTPGESHLIDNGMALNVAPGDYVVLCANDDPVVNGGVTCDYEYSNFNLMSTGDEVILVDDGVTPQIIARVAYDDGTTFPVTSGASMVYIPSAQPPTAGYYLDNNVAAQWGTSTSTYGDGDYGTPGAQNDQGGVITAVKFNGLAGSAFPGLAVVFVLAGGLVLLHKRK